MNWRNRSTSLFQMLGIVTSLAWSNAHTASRRRCLGIRGTREIGVVTSQDAADPPLRYPACNLSVEPRAWRRCWPGFGSGLGLVKEPMGVKVDAMVIVPLVLAA